MPPLWIQLAQLKWPEPARNSLRYIANTGGRMPRATLDSLRAALPKTLVFLMYGLTESFRSTYLPPSELDRRPDSIGKAIPNAEVLVVREDGTPCAPGEPGELVHRGALVSLGYWNDPAKTAERFKAAPGQPQGVVIREIAVWSGDTVQMDEEGFPYFISRRDDDQDLGLSREPHRDREVIYATGLIGEAAALGVPHPVLGRRSSSSRRLATGPARGGRFLAQCRQGCPRSWCRPAPAAGSPAAKSQRQDRSQAAGQEMQSAFEADRSPGPHEPC